MLANFNWIEAIGASPIFVILVVCSVVTLGVALERAAYYWKRRGDPDRMLSAALEKLRIGAVDEAVRICEASVHPAGPAARQILNQRTLPLVAAEERMQIALSQQKLLLERHVGVLGTMAAVAPLIGLLGTVWGIMRAFHDMALSGSAAPSVVAAGVAEALVTTAAGLVVAVPAVLLYNHFCRRMSVMLTVAENHARILREALLEHDTDRRHRGRSTSPPAYGTTAHHGMGPLLSSSSDWSDFEDDAGAADHRAA